MGLAALIAGFSANRKGTRVSNRRRKSRGGRPREARPRHACGRLVQGNKVITPELAMQRRAAVLGCQRDYQAGDVNAMIAVRAEPDVLASLEDPLGILRTRHDRGREAIGISPRHQHFGEQYARLRGLIFGKGQARIGSYGDSRSGDLRAGELPEGLVPEWLEAQKGLRGRGWVVNLILIDLFIPDAIDDAMIATLRAALEDLADHMHRLYPQRWEAFREAR